MEYFKLQSNKFLLLPNDVLRFLLNYLRNPEKCNIMIINKKFYRLIEDKKKYRENYIWDIIKYDYINLLRRLKKDDIPEYICNDAFRSGSIECLNYLRENSFALDEEYIYHITARSDH